MRPTLFPWHKKNIGADAYNSTNEGYEIADFKPLIGVNSTCLVRNNVCARASVCV